jgi:hypothetical protein
MATPHVSERPLLGKIVGGLRFGIAQSMLVDADLATSIALAKVAVDADNAKLHSSQKTFGERIKGSLDLVASYDSTYAAGSDADKATMLALSPQLNGGNATRF